MSNDVTTQRTEFARAVSPADTAAPATSDLSRSTDRASAGEPSRRIGALDRWRLANAKWPWVRAASVATSGWLVIHAAYVAVSVFVAARVPGRLGAYYPHQTIKGIFHSWFQWDAAWYTALAQHGYAYPYAQGQGRAPAFFPLYPILSRLADPILPGGIRVAAAVVANVALWGALVVLFRLTERELSTAAARRSTWYLLAFPTAFFLAAPFPNALFLLLAAGCAYAMRTGRWWTAGALAALAGATRSSGLLLVLPLGYEYLRQCEFQLRRIRWNVGGLLLAPAGLLAYMLYTAVVLRDPFAFMHAQRFWSRHFDLPTTAILRSVELAAHSRLVRDPVNALELGTVLLVTVALVLAVVGPWRMRRDQLAFPLFGLALVAFDVSFPSARWTAEPLLSASRHMLEPFPAFMMFGVFGSRPIFDRAYIAVGLTLQGVLLMLYLHQGWIA